MLANLIGGVLAGGITVLVNDFCVINKDSIIQNQPFIVILSVLIFFMLIALFYLASKVKDDVKLSYDKILIYKQIIYACIAVLILSTSGIVIMGIVYSFK